MFVDDDDDDGGICEFEFCSTKNTRTDLSSEQETIVFPSLHTTTTQNSKARK
jgi:hypothetical protein